MKAMGFKTFFIFFLSMVSLTCDSQGESNQGEKDQNIVNFNTPIQENKKFVIVSAFYNNIENVEDNLKSIYAQTYPHYRLLYIDDCTTDGTYEKARRIIKSFGKESQTMLIRNETRIGRMAGEYRAINHLVYDEEYIVSLDGDDQFAHEHVLENLNRYYANPDVWVTYGSFEIHEDHGKRLGFCRPVENSVLRKGAIRSYPWVTSHLKTFRSGLYKNIRSEDVKMNGEFVFTAPDMALMFPIVEMAGLHAYYNPNIEYLYNHKGIKHEDIESLAAQLATDKYLRSLPPYKACEEVPQGVRFGVKAQPVKIQVALAGSMEWTPFDSIHQNIKDNILTKVSDSQMKFTLTAHPLEAKIIVGRRMKDLEPFVCGDKKMPQKYLLWTHEPRFDIKRANIVKKCGRDIHVMNVYTDNGVYTNNYQHFKMQPRWELQQADEGTLQSKKKGVVLIASYGGMGPVGEDLIELRTRIALRGFELGKIDIFGPGWPDKISQGESRLDADWPDKKKAILKPYKYNLCFENTNIKNYVTEKIWDAIQAYALPIYYGNSWIYKDFPEESFIDYADFNSPDELFSFIEKMSNEEYLSRLNKCIKTYNRILREFESSNVFFERDEMIKKNLFELAFSSMYAGS